jgi:His-Xaa-Ser system protein HxsD
MKEHELNFDVRVFSIDTIKRALYRFSDKCSFDIHLKDSDVTVKIHTSANDDLLAKIKNEVLDQDLRDTLAKETANVRTLILANAFSNTGLIQ